MLKRVITGAVFAIVILAGIALQGWPLRLLILFAMLVSMYEMFKAMEAKGSHPVKWCGYVFAVLAFAFQAVKAEFAVAFFTVADPALCALLVGSILACSVVVLRGKVDFDAMESTLFPMIYPGALFAVMFAVQDMGNRYTATVALLLMFFAASVNDVFALFIGSRFGKHRLSPEISPRKSREGSVAGLVAGVLFAMFVAGVLRLLVERFPGINPEGYVLPALWKFAILGFVAAGLSQIGDLTASLVKRHCGIKDFGTIFPGHGGMMDRMDGILFCAAACWCFFCVMGL